MIIEYLNLVELDVEITYKNDGDFYSVKSITIEDKKGKVWDITSKLKENQINNIIKNKENRDNLNKRSFSEWKKDFCSWKNGFV